MSKDSQAELLRGLGALIGIPHLGADAQGNCRLLFDQGVAVEIRHVSAQGRWLLTCTLSGGPAESDLLRLLMRGNQMGAGFGGGWAGLDERGLVVLHLPLADQDASAEALLSAIEMLLSHGETWERRRQAPLVNTPQDEAQRMAAWAQRI